VVQAANVVVEAQEVQPAPVIKVHRLGYLQVSLQLVAGGTRSFSCRWAVSDGTRTVPASILSGLPLGSYQLSVNAVSSSGTQPAGAWSFTVSAMSQAGTINVTLAPSTP
jgi:predicted phage tail protein